LLEDRINETLDELQKCIETGRILDGKTEEEGLPQFQRIIADVKAMKEEASREMESYQKAQPQMPDEETIKK
ncbi:hypothetical protein PENTCL1PPCAC_11533, partial [Pristionchus entomophagus]